MPALCRSCIAGKWKPAFNKAWAFGQTPPHTLVIYSNLGLVLPNLVVTIFASQNPDQYQQQQAEPKMSCDTEPLLPLANTQSYEVEQQGAFAPPNYTNNPPIQIQESPGLITVQPSETVDVQNRSPGDHLLIISVVLTIICFFVGSWCALCCTIPAIVFAVNAYEADVRGDRKSMLNNHHIACCLNIVGFFLGLIILVSSVIVFFS